MIKAIVFDMNGVLVSNFDHNIYGQHANKLNLTTEEFKNILREYFSWSVLNKSQPIDHFWNSKKGDWRNITLEDLKSLLSDLHASETVNPVVLEIARNLKQNYKIGVLSNIGGVDLESLFERKYGIKNLFDYVFNSGNIGVSKPDPRVYEHMLSVMSMKPEEVVFIDDKEKNVEAAKQLGIRGIYFSSPDMEPSVLVEKLHSIGIKFPNNKKKNLQNLIDNIEEDNKHGHLALRDKPRGKEIW